MSFLREPKKLSKDDEYLEFMIREWYSDDNDNNDEEISKYNIYLFGVTQEGYSVCLSVQDFTPYFYVKVPDNWTTGDAQNFEYLFKKNYYYEGLYLLSAKLFKRKDAYGFNNLKEFNFIRLVFSNHKSYRSSIYKFKKPIKGYENVRFELYDTKLDPMLVFMHINNISASGWIKIHRKKLSNQIEKISRCQINLNCNWKDVKPSDKILIPPLVTLSFDLECYSWNGDFPDPKIYKNFISQIGNTLYKFGDTDTLRKVVIVVGDCDDVDGVEIISVKTEKECILKWCELIEKTDPDQLIGYNIDNFDWTYIWERSKLHGINDLICDRLPRLYHVVGQFKEDTLESNAYGFNIFNFIETIGVGQIDLLHWFKKNTKLDKYSLDFVSNKYLGDKKREVSPKQIFIWSGPEAKPSERAIVADYCAQDTALPIRLMENRSILPGLVEMSRVTCVPLTWLISRGEQIKAFSQISKELRNKKFVLPGHIEGTDDDYEGAVVLTAQRGFYTEPISGLDFASLYPSIMIAHNLCITTWVRMPKYRNIPGIEYEEFDDGLYTFAKNVKGVIPDILTRLWAERKRVRKEMLSIEDKNTLSIMNAKQLAIKVSMNSIYGVCGVGKGAMPCRAIAASVTYTGRKMLAHSMKCAEEWYDGSEQAGGVTAHVRYGDSVTPKTPVTLKSSDDKIEVREIQQLGSFWVSYENFKPGEPERTDKQQSIPEKETFIWTSNGWKKIRRVIRHKVNKRIFRVTTEKGVVEVTEDHSLIKPNGEYIKPKDISIGEELMHKQIEIN